MDEEEILIVPKSNYGVTVENLRLELTLVCESQRDKENHKKIQKDIQEEMGELSLHEHYYNEIFICMKGCMQIHSEDGTIFLEEGDITVIPPTYSHVKIPDKDENTCYEAIGFTFMKRHSKDSYDLYQLFDRIYHKRLPVVFQGKKDICEEVHKLTKSSSESKSYLPSLRLVQVLASLAETVDSAAVKATKNDEYIEPSVSSRDIDRMMTLEGLLNNYYMKDLTVERIAEQLFLSPRQVTRIIKQRYGTTLHRVIVNRRLEVAERMLKNTEFTAEDICKKVGFHTKTVFYSEFKRKHGMSPMNWRKECCK